MAFEKRISEINEVCLKLFMKKRFSKFKNNFSENIFPEHFLKKCCPKLILHSEKYFFEVIFEFQKIFSKTVFCILKSILEN